MQSIIYNLIINYGNYSNNSKYNKFIIIIITVEILFKCKF